MSDSLPCGCVAPRTDEYPCGCRWVREPGLGDVFVQCEEHAAGGGAPYPGSEPMTPEEAQEFAAGLSRALGGVRVEVLA